MREADSIHECERGTQPRWWRGTVACWTAWAMSVYLYTGLAAAHWASVAKLLNHPPDELWCGNVISDPLGI